MRGGLGGARRFGAHRGRRGAGHILAAARGLQLVLHVRRALPRKLCCHRRLLTGLRKTTQPVHHHHHHHHHHLQHPPLPHFSTQAHRRVLARWSTDANCMDSCVHLAGGDDARETASAQGERGVRSAQASHLPEPQPAHAQGRDPSHDHRLHREPRGAAGGRLRRQRNDHPQGEVCRVTGRHDVTKWLIGDVIHPARRPLWRHEIQGPSPFSIVFSAKQFYNILNSDVEAKTYAPSRVLIGLFLVFKHTCITACSHLPTFLPINFCRRQKILSPTGQITLDRICGFEDRIRLGRSASYHLMVNKDVYICIVSYIPSGACYRRMGVADLSNACSDWSVWSTVKKVGRQDVAQCSWQI